MISKKMAKALNEQVKYEFESYWIYMAMAFALETMNLKGFAQWFFGQAEEEKGHAMKIANYILDQGEEVLLTELAAPKTKYESVKAICKGALAHEKKITGDINKLVALARKENDYATETFLHWFVNEQVEEESSTQELVDMVSMATGPGQLLMLENRLSRSEG